MKKANLFILNPTAGKYDQSEELTKLVKDYFGERDDFEIVKTHYKGHATELTHAAGLSGIKCRIYALGGDGTLSEIVQGAYGFDNLSVTIFPCGTGNDFVKTFDSPELFRSVENLVNAKERKLDLIKCGEMIGINVSSVGFDAEVASRVGKMKKIPFISGSMAYMIALFYCFIFRTKRRFEIRIDDDIHFEKDLLFAVAANGRYYGAGFMPAPYARPDDGMLDFVLINAVSRLKMLSLIGKYKKGEHIEMKDLTFFKNASKLSVSSKSCFSINMDGECIKGDSVTFEIVPSAISFAVPE